MKFRKFLVKALPSIVAVMVFWAVATLYFAPQLSDRVVSMNDVQQYGGMGRDIWQHRDATGEDPQWTGGMFGGMPAYFISVEYPAMILRNAAGWLTGLMGEPSVLLFLAMTGFWLMLLMAGVDPWVAIPCALAYGLSTYNILIIEAGHITKMRAMGWAPMLVGAVFWTFRRNVWVGGALAALFGTLTIAAAHPQITYYFLLVLFAFWLNELIATARNRSHESTMSIWKRFCVATAVLAGAGVLAAGANFTHLWYTFEHSPDTTRGGSELVSEDDASRDGAAGLDLEYATAWSYGIGESFNMFIPAFQGGGSSETFDPQGEVAEALGEYGIARLATQLPTYWGEQPGTGGPTYIGAVVVFLFVLGMFVLPGRQKWWVLAVSVLALLLAWGRNAMWFTEFAFDALPGYNKFRTVAMALAVLQWSVPFLAALVLAKLWNRELDKERLKRGLFWSLGITGGVALLFAVLGGSLFDLASSADPGRMYNFALQGGLDEAGAARFADNIVGAMSAERLELLRADSLRSLIFVCLTAGVVWLWISRQSFKRWIPVAALGALILADLLPVDMRYLTWADFGPRTHTEVVPDAADLAIMEDTEPGFRVFNTANPFNEAYTSYFHRSVGGYQGAKLARYQDLIDRYLSKRDIGVLNMLDTKYFITTDPETGKRTAQRNPDANGAAWFVEDVRFVDGARAEIEALATLDNKREAVADSKFANMAGSVAENTAGYTAESATPIPDSTTPDSTAYIRLTEYRPNYLRYETHAASDRVAVFSEIYYDKGWRAFIDGDEAPYFRADYILRAMVVPAGDHTIEWRFRAPRFAAVEGVTLACSIAILLWLAAAILFDLRRKHLGEAKTDKQWFRKTKD